MSLCKVNNKEMLSEILYSKGSNKTKCIVKTGCVDGFIHNTGQLIGKLDSVVWGQPVDVIRELLDNAGMFPRFGAKALSPELKALYKLGFITYNKDYIVIDETLYKIYLYLGKVKKVNEANKSLLRTKKSLKDLG